MKNAKSDLLHAMTVDSGDLHSYCESLHRLHCGVKVENLKIDNAKQVILSLCQCIQNKLKSLDIAD